MQDPALREIGAPLAPIAIAPSIASWPFRPIVSGSSWVTRSVCLGLGVVGGEVGGAPGEPCSRCQRSSTGSGARKQVPELITVVPPTTFATGTGIGGRPAAIVSPASR